MIRSIYLNGKLVPVPVPVITMRELIDWLNGTFCTKGRMLTKLVVDGKDLEPDDTTEDLEVELNAEASIEAVVDSPSDLCTQTIAAVFEYAEVLHAQMEPLAVELFSERKLQSLERVKQIAEDLEIVFDLQGHVNGIVDPYHEDLAPFEGLLLVSRVVKNDLIKLLNKSDIDALAVALVKRLSPLLKELLKEVEELQIKLNNGFERLALASSE